MANVKEYPRPYQLRWKGFKLLVFFSLWEDSRQEVWSASQINDFLRSVLFLASMEIAKHDLYISASVFPVLQGKCLDTMFGTRI